MDKMRNLLKSPMSKRRAAPDVPAYIGKSLDELSRRESCPVPKLITKVCTFILENGIDNEGIFRVPPNNKLLGQLRTAYDKGEGDSVVMEDVNTACSLLKLFLRELDGAVVTRETTALMIASQKELGKDQNRCNAALSAAIKTLPAPNLAVLHYLMSFLVRISLHQNRNKMAPKALGIVFGPNLFESGDKKADLQQAGITNHLVSILITHFDKIFLANADFPPQASPYNKNFKLDNPVELTKHQPKVAWQMQPYKMAEELDEDSDDVSDDDDEEEDEDDDDDSTDNDYYDDFDDDEEEEEEEDIPTKTAPARPPPPKLRSNSVQSNGDEEALDSEEIVERAHSPFQLEAETPRSECTPRPSGSTEAVEKTISSVIGQRLFGDEDAVPTPAPRGKRSSGLEDDDEDRAAPTTVQQRIQQLQPGAEGDHEAGAANSGAAPRKRRPNSQAFQIFESTGTLISMVPKAEEDSPATDSDSHPRPVPKPRSPRKAPRLMSSAALSNEHSSSTSSSSQDSVHAAVHNEENAEEAAGFGSIEPTAGNTLIGFKRPRGPKNRRTPSRQSLKRSGSQEDELDVGDNAERGGDTPISPLHHIQENLSEEEEDSNTSSKEQQHRSIKFLDSHQHSNGGKNGSSNGTGQSNGSGSDGHSPQVDSQHKPFIPPLDLSILHEHADGSDPLPATVPPCQQPTDAALISPRITNLKLAANTKAHPCPDIDVPPSPPMDHGSSNRAFTNSTSSGVGGGTQASREDSLIKQLTRKIQSYKRKIKSFEETYEEEHGYRPSQTDKAADPDIKRYMQDLSRTRKELKRVKEEITAENLSHQPLAHGATIRSVSASSPSLPAGSPMSPAVRGGNADNGSHHTVTMAETLKAQLNRLKEKRKEAGRPEDIALMTPEQIHEEKLCVQKALLHFEGLHGRPGNKAEKDLMRPLYDRYRNVKRSLNKSTPTSATSADSVVGELQPVPEHHTIDFPDQPRQDGGAAGDVFLVTRDMRLMKNSTLRDGGGGSGSSSSTTTIAEEDDDDDDDDDEAATSGANESHRNLHCLSLRELQQELHRARSEKKKIRRVLRDYETEFIEKYGRKVQKEDRMPKEEEYHKYKQVKARLKLVEALIAKHDPVEP